MNRRWLPALLAAGVAMAVSGCFGASGGAEGEPPGTNAPLPVDEQPESAEAPAPPSEVVRAPESESESETPGAEPAELSVTTGGSVALDTELEHVEAAFEGTEYTIEPYGVTFALRTGMGEPAVEEARVVFSSELSGEGAISYEVMPDTTLEEAVDRELGRGGAFYGEFIETVSSGGLPGKHNQYEDETAFAGVFLYAFDRHALRIEYRWPIDAVDAAVRIVAETTDSVRLRE